MELGRLGDLGRKQGLWRALLIGGLALLLLAGGGLWGFRDYWRSPQALVREAQSARPERAAVLYARLAERLPVIEEYARLWAAEAAMPDLEALRTLQAVADFRPQSPAAYHAHLILARYYAGLEVPQAEDRYRAALALDDPAALRLELARTLEAQGDLEGAYAEYRRLLGPRPDAFEGMRRTGQGPLAVARDLLTAQYYSDALEVLRTVEDPAALPLRAAALAGLGRHQEARTAYEESLVATPEDGEAQLGLARSLERLGLTDEALASYAELDSADGRLAQAGLLQGSDPAQALALYGDVPYPEAWWSAGGLLEEQGRAAEALPFYARLASGSSYLADDAAYRLTVLAGRLGDTDAQEEGRAFLAGLGPNWLALRAGVGVPVPGNGPPLSADGGEVLAKVQALESIGRADLAHQELTLAARFRSLAEIDLAMAQALDERGFLLESQAIAAEYTRRDPGAPPAFWELSYPRPYSATVEAAAEEYDLDPRLIWAVMRAESLYDPEAVSYVGARGLMQVMPSTQEWIAEMWGRPIPLTAALSPEPNIRMGAWFLRFLLDYFDDDLELAVAAYNGGSGSVDAWLADPRVTDRDDLLRWIAFGETREYIARVLLNYRIYEALYPGPEQE